MTDKQKTTDKEPESDEERLIRFKEDINKDADVMTDQSIAADEDMRFINEIGGMWEGFFEEEVGDRIKLEFDIVSDYVNRFIGEWNQNRVGVDFKPDDSSGRTSDEDAELLNGIYRADFRQFSGKMALDNAVDEVATCGYGCYKLGTVFEDEEDPENDLQRIDFRPIYNAYETIFWDNAAKRIDKRDARWCTQLIQFTKDSFEEAYPDSVAVSVYEPESRWFNNSSSTHQQELIYIGKRYEIVREEVSVFVYNNLQSNEVEVYDEEDHEDIKAELKKDEFRKFVRERKVIKQSVETTVFSGDEILEDTKRITGKWIPIIPIYGYRAYIQGVEWYRGLVRNLKDAARLFNMQMSQLAENAASEGQEVPIFDPDQMASKEIQDIWADKNNKPYLLASSLRDNGGNIIQHGPIGYLKAPQLSGSTIALMQVVPGYIQQRTGGAPQDTIDPNASGKAINAMRKRENLNTQVILDNISNSVEWGGTVYQFMSDEVYTTERIVTTIGKDGTEGKQQLLKTVLDEETGRPVESNNLNGKKFRAYSDIGPQYDTLREQTVEELKGMLGAIVNIPGGEQYAPAILSTMLDNITGVGLGPLKDLNRRNMLLQGIVKPETDEEKAMVAQAQQPQADPNQKLIEAATQQQLSEARNLDSDSLDNVASAEKKQAETQKIISETENGRVKTLLEIREEQFKQTASFPFNTTVQ